MLLLFRTANFCTTRRIYRYIGLPYLIFYRILVEWFFSIELPWRAQIGRNLKLFHAEALVVSHEVVIGENCTLRQSTTIGIKNLPDGSVSRSPVIGDNVDIGCNVCVIGPVTIGNDVKIGAGAVVVKNVPPYSVVIGNPAIIKPRKDIEPVNLPQLNEQAADII